MTHETTVVHSWGYNVTIWRFTLMMMMLTYSCIMKYNLCMKDGWRLSKWCMETEMHCFTTRYTRFWQVHTRFNCPWGNMLSLWYEWWVLELYWSIVTLLCEIPPLLFIYIIFVLFTVFFLISLLIILSSYHIGVLAYITVNS